MKQLTTIVLLLFCLSAIAQDKLNLVPMPAKIVYPAKAGNFYLSQATPIVVENEGLLNAAKLLQALVKKRFGIGLKIIRDRYRGGIHLDYDHVNSYLKNACTVNVVDSKVDIHGQNNEAVFNGIQTLLQLLETKNYKPQTTNHKLSIPYLSITDYPRFAYRGMHLDVARHFMPVDFVKKYIDYLAAYKFNTFHWHLTDDQGWRIEIKKYPRLTQVGGWRNGTIIGRYPGKGNDNKRHGGFYTQEQIKEVIKYAADRYITVIPEIELPGHASAAIAAYPQLSCFPDEDTKVPAGCSWSGVVKGKMVQQTWGVFEDVFSPTEYTFAFLQDVLDEVITLFPSKYIHIGGDECPKESWKRSAFCQQLIRDKNLKDEHGLQSYFISRIEKYINSKGRNIIGWDEILEGGLAPNATVMSWRGEEGGIEAAKQNHDVVMTPGSYCYFDHSQSKIEDSVTIGGYLPLEKVYSYEPVPDVLNAEQAKHILGAQANLWTEYIEHTSKVEYMIFPRMLALSEVLWSPKEKRNWQDFERRLPVLLGRLDNQGINYSRAYYDLSTVVRPAAAGGIEWVVSSKQKNEEIKASYTGPLKIALQQNSTGEVVLPVTHQGVYMANTAMAGPGVKQQFKLNKATGKKITMVNPPSKSYPGDGAFTLVNGVQNDKGLSKSSEFLGFSGTDLDVTIDLGSIMEVKKVLLHTLGQTGSWIYQPAKVEVQYMMSLDTENTPIAAPLITATVDVVQQNGNSIIEVPGNYNCRYIRVIAKNYGVIPAGNAGAGEKAWLFADEIEVE